MGTSKPRRPRLHKAVIDRLEDGKWAVLLVGREEFEKIIPVERLPQGARAGSWLKVRLEADEVREIEVDEVETRAAARRVHSKLEMLRQRGAHFKPVESQTQTGAEEQETHESQRKPATHQGAAAMQAEDEAADASEDVPPKLLTGPTDDDGAGDEEN